MRLTLLHYLATQTLPATVAGAQGVAAVAALVQDGHVKAVFSLAGSAATQPPTATVTAFTRLGRRALRRLRPMRQPA